MAGTQIKRIFYLGLVNVVRNSFVSFSVVFIMTVSLFIVGFSLLFGQVMNDVTEELRNKVDVTAYFITDTPEEQILAFRDRLEELSQVREVFYVSQETALEEYRKRHENDLDILHGLDLLKETETPNPFRARLSIRAQQSGDFESIVRFLDNEDVLSDNPSTVIDKIDFYQNRQVIMRLSSVVDTATLLTHVVIALLIFISFIIVFNIIRLIIYLSREEIKVMRLIGAEDWYVRAPFLVSGGIYGLVGSILATVMLYPISYWLSPVVERFFEGQGLFSYYISEFFVLVLILTALGVFVGVFSSYLSSHRYLDD
ncbi:MAG: permease-like cell division protein FtsX [Candidatus Kaiserbacteria bacterium]|nr:permease-like cell division protein FtsX [Candidatus Kaiserbacteria bacterium]